LGSEKLLKRIIARLDIKGANLIKSINLEGLRVIGDPGLYALEYYQNGIDELLFIDCVASLYGRNQLTEIISNATKNIFVPITVGGGLRTLYDVENALRTGADKVAINTAAIKNPKLITEIAKNFGSQSLVLSIVVSKVYGDNKWRLFIENGREMVVDLEMTEWMKQGVDLGAGEILVTSIDKEGTREGFDLELLRVARKITNVPLIASGGMGSLENFREVVSECDVDGVAIADMFHYRRLSIPEIKKFAVKCNIDIRPYE
jgi:imidazole glycerol-phosphate synthase subunit HisF